MQAQLFRSGMMMEEGYDMMGSMDEEMPPPRKAEHKRNHAFQCVSSLFNTFEITEL